MSVLRQSFLERTVPRSIGWLRLAGVIFYFGVAVLLSVHCYNIPTNGIDLLGYSGNLALADTHDIVSAHRAVYREALTPHLLGQDANDAQAAVLRRRAQDPYFSALYLPYFSIKPLYILTLQLVHKLGAGIIDSSRIVAALGYFAVAVIVWLYTRTALSVLLLILPEAIVLGGADGPDSLSVFLLLAGLWVLFVKQHDLGLLPMMLAMWMRPENLIYCVLVILLLLADRRLDWKKTGAMLCLCLGSSALISHYAYGWKDLCFHTFLDGEPGQVAQFGMSDYLRAFTQNVYQVTHGSVIVFSLLWLACFGFMDRGFQRIMAVAAGGSVMRFVIFPSYQSRYYSLFFLTTAIAGMTLASKTRGVEWLRTWWKEALVSRGTP